MSLGKYSNEELHNELKHREENPTWFFRDLVEEGYDLEDEGFQEATAWMDDSSSCKNSDGEWLCHPGWS